MTGQNQTKEGQNQTKETEENPSMCLTRVECREARRRLMAARFYYWTEVRRRRFDDVMHILSEHEFFVDERSIMDVLRGVSHYLSDLHTRRETAGAPPPAFPPRDWGGPRPPKRLTTTNQRVPLLEISLRA